MNRKGIGFPSTDFEPRKLWRERDATDHYTIVANYIVYMLIFNQMGTLIATKIIRAFNKNVKMCKNVCNV